MIIFDLFIVVMSLAMLLIFMPRVRKKFKEGSSGMCAGCGINLAELFTQSITEKEMDDAMKAHRRGTCDACQTQIEREEQLNEVFTPKIVSTIKRKSAKIVQYKFTTTILFFSSAIFGVMPVSGDIKLVFKLLQVITLGLGWTILFISLKKR
jgi:hypothetical protein